MDLEVLLQELLNRPTSTWNWTQPCRLWGKHTNQHPHRLSPTVTGSIGKSTKCFQAFRNIKQLPKRRNIFYFSLIPCFVFVLLFSALPPISRTSAFAVECVMLQKLLVYSLMPRLITNDWMEAALTLSHLLRNGIALNAIIESRIETILNMLMPLTGFV